MSFPTNLAFNCIVIFPAPKSSANCSVVFATFYAYEFLGFFTPSYSIEMSRLPASAAHKSPVPFTSRIITFQVTSCFAQWITLVKRVNQLAILTNHGFVTAK